MNKADFDAIPPELFRGQRLGAAFRFGRTHLDEGLLRGHRGRFVCVRECFDLMLHANRCPVSGTLLETTFWEGNSEHFELIMGQNRLPRLVDAPLYCFDAIADCEMHE